VGFLLLGDRGLVVIISGVGGYMRPVEIILRMIDVKMMEMPTGTKKLFAV